MCIRDRSVVPSVRCVRYSQPVSYTHLDVYKRQSYDRSDKARERDDTQNRDNYRRNFTPPAHSIKPVSYTHLDVYKRQHAAYIQTLSENVSQSKVFLCIGFLF